MKQGPKGVQHDASSLPDPSRLSLHDKAVHVWVLDEHCVGQACSVLAGTLSPDEQQRARVYKHEGSRNRFIARRSMLRRLIGSYLNCQPESLRFSVTEFGKPALRWPPAARLAFNVSQTDGIALFAFALDCHVGVDVQRRIDGVDVAGIGRGIFSSIEERRLDAARPASVETFLSLWTRKEALLKALGTGLRVKPDAYTTEDDREHGQCRWRASYEGTLMSGWTCVDLDLGSELRCALAVSIEDAPVTLFHCPRLT